jgi:hypothetical protein
MTRILPEARIAAIAARARGGHILALDRRRPAATLAP